MRRTVLVMVAMLSLVAVACGSDEPAPVETGVDAATGTFGDTGATGGDACEDQTGADTFTVELADFEIVPACLTVRGDQSSEVTNSGAVAHTFTILDTEIDVEISPGDTSRFEATGLDPGSYTLQCRFHPGSMVAELRVE
jgi:plastocyanin